MKILALLSVIFLFSCSKEKVDKEQWREIITNSRKESNINIFKSKLVVILAKKAKANDRSITIQDYVENGTSFIPIFSSMEKFKESTKGTDIGAEKIEMDGMLILSLMKGNETLRLNPTLKDEQYFKASELLATYKTEIESFKQTMNQSSR